MDNSHNSRKSQELESIKYKLQMVSKNCKTSKLTVDDYISNIIGSGLDISKPVDRRKKLESQSANNVQYAESMTHLPGFNDVLGAGPRASMRHIPQLTHQRGSGIQHDFYEALPTLYRDLIHHVQSSHPVSESSEPHLDTGRIAALFTRSGLPQSVLGEVWAAVSRTRAGQLTVLEFCVAVSMLAHLQQQPLAGQAVPSWDTVIATGQFPLPQLEPDHVQLSQDAVAQPHRHGHTVHHAISHKDADDWADFNTAASTKFSQPEPSNVDWEFGEFQNFSTTSSQTTPQKPTTSAANHSVTVIDLSTNHRSPVIDLTLVTNQSPRAHHQAVIANHNPMEESLQQYQPANQNGSISGLQPITTVPDVAPFYQPDDKYQVFNNDLKSPSDHLLEQWILCLRCCLQIISDVVKVLEHVYGDGDDHESVLLDVFQSEKGSQTLAGVMEVYRVARNIRLSAARAALVTGSESLVTVLSGIEDCWNRFMLLVPDHMQIEIQTQLSRPIVDDYSGHSPANDGPRSDLCGVCLCHLAPVNGSTRSSSTGFLCHGIHKYHCACANLWVNNLNLTLPGLVAYAPPPLLLLLPPE